MPDMAAGFELFPADCEDHFGVHEYDGEIGDDDDDPCINEVDKMEHEDKQPEMELVEFDTVLIGLDQNEYLNRPLYAGASITVLQAVVDHLLWFTDHPYFSKEAFSDMLHMEHYSTLPKDNLLPSSYTTLMRIVAPYLVTPEVFDCCPNDCILFGGEYL